MPHAIVIAKPGFYYIVRLVIQGTIVYQQRFEYWQESQAYALCDAFNSMGKQKRRAA